MGQYIARRLVQAALVVFGVVTAVFFLLQLTGDPVRLMFGQSIPNFWLGIMLILVFAVLFGWLPSQGYGEGDLKHLLLPTLTLAAPGLARLTRLVRSGMLDVLGQDYVR